MTRKLYFYLGTTLLKKCPFLYNHAYLSNSLHHLEICLFDIRWCATIVVVINSS